MNRIQFAAIAALMLPALSDRATAVPGNTANGERLYRACIACHSLEPNRNMTGPSFAEIWNRKSGSLASFPRYSPALKSAGIVWNDDTLDEWIKDPQHFIPANTMTFPGVKDARQRTDLLAFLKDATQPGRAPAAAPGGNQMGGMMGMMGGGAVPNLKTLVPGTASSRSIIAGIPTRSRRPTGRPAISGNAICASRRTSATTVRRRERPPSFPRE
jgi:cytochrome c